MIGSKKRKQIGAVLLASVLMLSQLGMTAYAEGNTAGNGLCEHHRTHDGNCGYIEAVEGHACGHEHTSDCYTDELVCSYDDEGLQTGSDAGHEHTAMCYQLNCQHEHDDTCGYLEAVKGQTCGYVCEACTGDTDKDSGREESTISGNDLTPTKKTEPGTVQLQGTERIAVTSFDELGREVKHQEVPLGTPESSVNLPAALGATGCLMTGHTAPDPEAITIECVTWELTGEKNSPAVYEEGRDNPAIYYYRAVLPESYELTGDTALPEIEVWYGMANRAGGNDDINGDGYSDTDVAAINAIIDKNGLLEPKDEPANWENLSSFAKWDKSTPKRITELKLAFKSLYGTLDVSGLTALSRLDCSANQIEVLNLSGLKNLSELYCSMNELTELKGLGDLTALTKLNCDVNQLDELTGLDKLTKLFFLDCYHNQLNGTLNVGHLSDLIHLGCAENLLTEIKGLGNLHALQSLECYTNHLTTLDITGSDYLSSVSAKDNPFQSIQTGNGKLTINTGEGGIVSVSFPTAKSLELIPQPDAGYKFSGWAKLPAGVMPDSSNKVTFEMTGDTEVVATFICTDATLRTLSLSSGMLTPAFDPAITAYTASVENRVANVTITAIPNSAKATVAGDGNTLLTVGNNLLTITVTAEDGTPKNYTINITRESAPSSDGDGSSHSIITIPEPPKPDIPELAVNELPVSVTEGKLATGTVDDGHISAALADAGKKAGAKQNGIAVQFDAKSALIYDSFTITVGRAALDRLIAAKVKYLTLNTSIVDLTFDLAALQEIAASSTGDITLTAARETSLTGDALAAVSSRPAYRLTVGYTGADGKAATVTSFGAGRVTVGVAYKPSETEQTGSLYLVYSADGRGAEWQYQSSYSRNSGNVIGSVGHFSVYGVGYLPAPSYSDTINHWAKADIDFAASRGLLSGTSETTFSPDLHVTRGIFVMALGKLDVIKTADYTSSLFADVPDSAVYAPYVMWAASKGIVNGTGENSFHPDAPITREQMAVIMRQYADKLGYTLPVAREAVTFTDNNQITGGMKDAVQQVRQAGIMSGKENNRFGPKDAATRAEAATVLRRFVEVVIDRSTASGWGQNDAGRWLYYLDGKPVTGWKQIGGNWYYFYPDGYMAADTQIDGREIGTDGAWKE